MTDKSLVVLMNGASVGHLFSNRNGRLRFLYLEEARTGMDAVPLSLSLPLARREHSHDAVDAYLWGLLPDNERVLERWAQRFHVSARSPFALLAHVGEDCAGAVQIAPLERADALQAQGPLRVDWLTERQVAERLRMLRADESAWRRSDDEGQFSLAGAQPKTALFFQQGRWGVPLGRTPTTHILKPPVAALDGQLENEHFCLSLARALQMPTVPSAIMRFGDEVAIVIERYDRVRLSKSQAVFRLHQEDACQALAIRPQSKYQAEGGPSPEQIAELLRVYSDRPREDVQTFAEALVFNWLAGGTDGHAKNYSLLHGAGGHVRLAPLYDIASALPYPHLNTPRLRLAMKIGGHYRLREIGARKVQKAAEGMQLDPARFLERARELCELLPSSAQSVHTECKRNGLDHPILSRLVRALTTRAKACTKALRG